MTTSFNEMMSRILLHEGKYTNNPLDRGNWTGGKVGAGKLRGTKYGVSAMSYPHLNIKNLTKDQACEVYRKDFYLPFQVGVTGAAARYQLLDYAVNSGVRRASKALQKAVGAKPDGILGPKTRALCLLVPDQSIALRVLAYRLDFMASLSVWRTFGRGWARRIAANLRFAVQDLQEES